MAGAAQRWKEIFLQVTLITVGVVIALAFDGMTAIWHDRALVREARTNLSSEIQDNRKELALVRQRMDATDEQLRRGMSVVVALLDGQTPPGGPPFGIGTHMAEFQDSSRVTAQATGAFALMPYGEVKQYARVYAAQDRFVRAQGEFLQQMMKTLAEGEVLNDKSTPSKAELQQLQRDLRQCAVLLLVLRQFAGDLAADFERASKTN